MSGLGRRVGVLERSAVDRRFREAAVRVAARRGGSVDEAEARLRDWGTRIRERFGPRPDPEAVAAWAQAEYGLDPAKVLANFAEIRRAGRPEGEG